MISKWTRETVSSASTRSFSGALPTRNVLSLIMNSVPRCVPLITTSLHRRRLTVAGVASRRIRVPVKCSIAKMVPHRATASLALFDCSNESTVCKVLRFWGAALASVIAPAVVLADGKTPDNPPADPTTAPVKPSDAPLPSCLDQTIREQLGEQLKPRGVQKRDFKKTKKIVLHPFAGLFGGDLTSSSWI